MTQPGSSLNTAFHALAQPLMRMRISLEMAELNAQANANLRQHVEESIAALDQLTSDVAVLREIICLGPAPQADVCDAAELLRDAAEDLGALVRGHGMDVRIPGETLRVHCNASLLRRALFQLIDLMASGSEPGPPLVIGLRREAASVLLEATAPPSSLRQILCMNLLAAAGGRPMNSESSLRMLYRAEAPRQAGQKTSADKSLLTAD